MKSRRTAYGANLFPAVLLASLLFASPAVAQRARPGTAQSIEAARAHFDRGIALRDHARWAEALAEFQASRALVMTLHGTTNAAACLVNLERYPEALEMYESALRDFSEKLKAEDKRDLLLVIKLVDNSVGTIEIEGSEPGATILLDGVSRGETPLGAPLRVSRGAHTIRVVKEGYEPFEQRLDVAGGTKVHATARLSRIQEIQETGPIEIAEAPRQDASVGRGKDDAPRATLERGATTIAAPKERRPRRSARFLVELDAAAPLITSLGGDASAGCMASCSEALGYGPGFIARGGYAIADLSFGISAGFLSMAQVIRGRSAKVEVAGMSPRSLDVDDAVGLRGALLGVWVGYSWGETLLLHMRLGAGGLLGAMTDSRTSAQGLRGGALSFGPLNQSTAARFLYIAPEVLAGIRLARSVELTLGLEVPVFVGAARPAWTKQVFADTMSGSDSGSNAWFPAAFLTSPIVAMLVPALGVRYDFY